MTEEDNKKYGDPIPQIPSLTDETWELLEYRIWGKFKNKLWSYVGAFLTVCTLAGVFGVSAYIDKRVDKKVEAERKQLEDARVNFLEESKKLTQLIRLGHYISSEYVNDVIVFDRALRGSKAQIIKLRSENKFSKNEEDNLVSIIEILEGFDAAFFDYYILVRQAALILNDIGYKKENIKTSKLLKQDWELLEKGLEKYPIPGFGEALQIYPHLYSLNEVHKNVIFYSLKKTLQKPVTRADIYQEYEDVITPEYLKQMEKFSLPFNVHQSGGKFGWATLNTSAKQAFILMELKAKEKDK